VLTQDSRTDNTDAGTSAESLLSAVGSTPLVEIDAGEEAPVGTRLFAKLETVNPSGSIKDRPVARMLTRALARGDLRDRRLLDSSSGNAGISYAQFGAALSIPVTLVVPGNASRERLDRIRSYGAELILTDPLEGYDHAIATARRMAREKPDRYWYADQYTNDDNWGAHFETTGPELLDQVREATGALPDAFVAGVGTGGTLTGVGRRLRQAVPDIHIACVYPELFPGIEGLKPLGHPDDLSPRSWTRPSSTSGSTPRRKRPSPPVSTSLGTGSSWGHRPVPMSTPRAIWLPRGASDSWSPS